MRAGWCFFWALRCQCEFVLAFVAFLVIVLPDFTGLCSIVKITKIGYGQKLKLSTLCYWASLSWSFAWPDGTAAAASSQDASLIQLEVSKVWKIWLRKNLRKEKVYFLIEWGYVVTVAAQDALRPRPGAASVEAAARMITVAHHRDRSQRMKRVQQPSLRQC